MAGEHHRDHRRSGSPVELADRHQHHRGTSRYLVADHIDTGESPSHGPASEYRHRTDATLTRPRTPTTGHPPTRVRPASTTNRPPGIRRSLVRTALGTSRRTRAPSAVAERRTVGDLGAVGRPECSGRPGECFRDPVGRYRAAGTPRLYSVSVVVTRRRLAGWWCLNQTSCRHRTS